MDPGTAATPRPKCVAHGSALVNLHITFRIWRSIGIFVLGFVLLTVLAQVQGLNTEKRLRETSALLYPEALNSLEAEAAFRQAVKEFSDAVVIGESSGLANGAAQIGYAVKCLRAVAALPGIQKKRAAQVRGLAASIEQFGDEARLTYGAAVAFQDHMAPELQSRVQDLASRTIAINLSLRKARSGFSRDLLMQLTTLQDRSAMLRRLSLTVLCLTLLVAGILVNMTIRSAIIRPLALAEAELAHERDLLRILLDNIPDCIYFKDTASRFQRINKAQAAILGLDDPLDALGRTDLDFFGAETAGSFYRDEMEIVRSGEPLVGKVEHISGSGSVHWMTATKVPVKDEHGRVTGIVGISRDITAWKEASDALESSEKSFRLLFSVIPHAVWVYDARTLRFLEVNESAVRRYGYSVEEFLKMRVTAILPPGDSARVLDMISHLNPSNPPNGLRKHVTKDGRILDVEVGAHVFDFRNHRCVMVVAHDMTERKKLELDLQQAHRLEAVGQLAAGIAHEINTPIQYIGDNLRFALDAFRARQTVVAAYEELRTAAEAGEVTPALLAKLRQVMDDADCEYLKQQIPDALAQSLDGVERVATIVRAMKEFSHPGRKEKSAADLNKSLSNALIVSRNETKHVADVETDFGPLPPVLCHVAEINQVLLNLIVNATDAIQDVIRGTQQRGRITLRTRQVADQAVISVSDTGCGIPSHIQARVFDPFFTTKEVGRGSGQGLAIARAIVVEKHGGTIHFEPNGSQGTTFIISLPIGLAPAVADDEGLIDCGKEVSREAHPVC